MAPPFRILQDEDAVARRVRELSGEIAALAPVEDLVVVGLLTGSFVFVADLVRELYRRGLDPRVELLHASHRGASRAATGRVALGSLDPQAVRGRAVLLVDDILDSGHTLARARDLVAAAGASWLRTCVLLDKGAGRRVDVEADHVGFPAPDAWVVGYGLDDGGALRGLPCLAVLDPLTAR